MNSRDANRFIQAVFSDVPDSAIEWISANLAPEDVFSDYMLSEWAIFNGFTKTLDAD